VPAPVTKATFCDATIAASEWLNRSSGYPEGSGAQPQWPTDGGGRQLASAAAASLSMLR
jgi:hypothetical protein